MRIIFMTLFISSCFPMHLLAQTPADKTQQLVKELKTLTDQAERDRAADYRFIDQLRDLTARYDRPWRDRLIFDNFKDGELQRNPVWYSNSRNFWVAPAIGLRTQLPLPHKHQPENKPSREQLLLGMLLDGAMRDQQTGPAITETRADISTQASISNAFAITIQISSPEKGQQGNFEWGLYQGNNMESGYRLSYQGGTQPTLKLLAYRNGMATVIDQYDRGKLLEDGNLHKITWQRTANGMMSVMMNRKRLIQVHDQSYRDTFSGFVMTNRGGDFAIRAVSVLGSN